MTHRFARLAAFTAAFCTIGASVALARPIPRDPDLHLWINMTEELTSGLARHNGFVQPSGNIMYALVFNRKKGIEYLSKQYTVEFEKEGKTMPADFFKPLEEKLDGLWAEIERLAPTFAFPKGLPSEPALEAIARAKIKAIHTGATVVKTAILYNHWSISKNDIGLPLSRYRTGVMLYKVPGSKYFLYREWTITEPYAGGGRYEKSDQVQFSGIRFQTHD